LRKILLLNATDEGVEVFFLYFLLLSLVCFDLDI